MSLCIVMPAYNEEACVEKVTAQWLSVLKDDEQGALIVVNDGSKDGTGAILDRIAASEPRLKVVHQPNAGHGAAVMRGYAEAIASGAEYIFQTDSDDQFMAADFSKLWAKRHESPFILGYRKHRSDSLHRHMITRILILLNFLFFGVRLKDSNVPFRLIRARFLAELLQLFPNDVFAPNIFLSILAVKAGSELFEIPIAHQERKTGSVSIIRWKLIKICFRCFQEMAAFRLSLLRQRRRIKALRIDYGRA